MDVNAPRTPPAPRMASVIIPRPGRLEQTSCCLAALARHTRMPWELILVADGPPADGMAEYLRGFREGSAVPLSLIASPEDRGVPDARRRGLAAARGDYLVLLDVDVVVTDAWLDQLIALADSGPSIGMAGPMANDVEPPQLAEGAPGGDLEAMHRFAARWRSEHRGRWSTAAALSGACVLIKRAALEAAGGPGPLDDLASRIGRAGYKLAVARDLFVHRARPSPAASAGRAVAEGPRDGPSVPERLPDGFAAPRLAPGSSREMVDQSLAILAAFEGTPGQKASLWERLADQIAEHGRRNGSTWGMERLPGADGSIIYMGRASEFLVFDASGGLARGRGVGCLAGSRGDLLVPHHPAMRPAR